MIERIIKKRAKRSIIWQMSSDELKEIVSKSKTLKEILDVFGLQNKGGNSNTLKRRLNEENIDYSHIKLGLDTNKGRKFNIKPLDFSELFQADSIHSRVTVKKYIIKHQLLPYKCACCGFEGKWQEKDLVLILDHINGINNDNRLENLRFLCPNCNSQQDTFSGKNNKKRYNFCVDCGKEISFRSTRCLSCSNKIKNISKKPSREQLLIDVENLSNVKIGLKYGVSETCVRKWRKSYEI